MSRRAAGALVVVLLAAVFGLARTSRAETGIVRVMIAGAFGAPMGTSGDGQITLRIGAGLPTYLVSGGAVVPGPLATAIFAQWTDTMPTTGFGTTSTLMVFRLAGGFMVVAGGVATPAGFMSTFSATTPAETLSGTWTIGSGVGTSGAGANDAVVTFTYDTNPTITLSGVVSFVAGGAVSALTPKVISGVGGTDVLRNIPVSSVVSNAKGAQVGTLMSRSAYNIVGHGSEFVELKAIDFGGGVFVLYGCAFPDATSSIACLVGATGSASHLSGRITQLAGMFSSITGVTPADLVLRLTGALP